MLIRLMFWCNDISEWKDKKLAAPARVFTDTDARRLAKAVVRDDAVKVKRFLDAGVDVNVVGEDGVNLLRLAMFNDSRSAFETLLEAGIDTGHRDDSGMTVLHRAASYSDPWYVRKMLEYPVDLDAVEPVGHHTPLMDAESNYEQFRMLLDAGADVSMNDALGEPILHRVARLQEYRAVLDLLEVGADPARKNDRGRTFQDYLRLEMAKDRDSPQLLEQITDWLRSRDIPVTLGPAGSVDRRGGAVLAVGNVRRDDVWEPVFQIDSRQFERPMEFAIACQSALNEMDRDGIPLRIDQKAYAFTDAVFQLPSWEEYRRQLS
ncbi:ankyrin repeat domain-containing protein [Nocardia arizonensis]|uniref:ankyrin repeat domain-containing protein n=1 Tax=Nocardia arizonensis TaxID=1141647 RepID=UPI0006D17444|nr:ankyrin repeat domain-containing protein [Nocardia arizonensis]